MAISNRGSYEAPAKSPHNFENYDSDLERQMMERLEADVEVVRWQKHHRISISWLDPNGVHRKYRPDFLVEYTDGRKKIIEVKDPSMIDSPAVQRKRRAAEEWCRKRGMSYEIATITR